MSVSIREFRRIASILEALGWRIEQTQNQGGHNAKRTIHSLCYPPDGGQPRMLGTSSHPRARLNTYADFRRAGVELDKRRLQRRPKGGQ